MRILHDPAPRRTEEIFSPGDLARFRQSHDLIEYDGGDREAFYARHLAGTEVLIGQQPMPLERLDTAPRLRAIFNVETNFLPNIDYEACFARGIHVLAPSSVFAVPVAEIGSAWRCHWPAGSTPATAISSRAARNTGSRATRTRNS